MYGAAGVLGEVVTTGLRSHGRDGTWRLTGHTYLWMLPVYAVGGLLLEPVHDRVRDRPAWQRAPVWTAGTYLVEAGAGEVLRRLTGEVPWDYARPRGRAPVGRHWRGLVKPAYAPQWALLGLAAERLHDALVPPGGRQV